MINVIKYQVCLTTGIRHSTANTSRTNMFRIKRSIQIDIFAKESFSLPRFIRPKDDLYLSPLRLPVADISTRFGHFARRPITTKRDVIILFLFTQRRRRRGFRHGHAFVARTLPDAPILLHFADNLQIVAMLRIDNRTTANAGATIPRMGVEFERRASNRGSLARLYIKRPHALDVIGINAA